MGVSPFFAEPMCCVVGKTPVFTGFVRNTFETLTFLESIGLKKTDKNRLGIDSENIAKPRIYWVRNR